MSRRKFLFYLTAGVAVGCTSTETPTGTASPKPSPSEITVEPSPSATATPTPTPPSTPPWNGEGTLREYYLYGKYPQAEKDAVAQTIGKLFRHQNHSQQHQIVAEILSYHHVIFHTTKLHDLRNNHKVIRHHRDSLRKMCEKYRVPFLPVLAITSWENSGGSTKVSWADAVGLGMMTRGAIDQAHEHAAEKAKRLKEAAQWKAYQAEILENDRMRRDAEAMNRRAASMNVEQRHRKIATDAKVEDERMIAECNLEDVVLFFDYLLSQYRGRVDHAIAAYHKGVRNQDDIIFDYLRRRSPSVVYPKKKARDSFLDTLEQMDVTYLDLWNDTRCREMLNGLRTVEGKPTTPRNSHMALGDESDIYPWKVLGSLSALLAGEEYLNRTVERYSGGQLVGEVRDLPTFLGKEGKSEGTRLGCLVPFPQECWQGPISQERQAWIRPELAGYLYGLREQMSGALGLKQWTIPILALGSASEGGKAWEKELHSKGVAVKIPALGNKADKALRKILNRDYLFDRIYLRSTRYQHHFVLNPRFGDDYRKRFEAKSKKS